MHIRVHLIIWSLLIWSSTCTLTEEDWDKLLPGMTTLCPNVDFCGKTQPPSGNVTTKSNTCCRGCSCASNCSKSRDCCDGTGNVDEQIECLKPSTDQELIIEAYEFVAKPPIGGCKMLKDQSKKGNVTCSSDEVVAPWGNFLPVYSSALKRNFKNAACAKCHGARDIEEWISSLFIDSGDDYVQSLNDTICATPYCPISQVRLKDGHCGYTAKFVRIEKLLLCLNVSNEKAPFQLNISQMTAPEINSLFKEKSPWSENWMIFFIGSLIDGGSNKSEFLICLVYMTKNINLESLNKEIRRSLLKKWKVGSGKDEGFDQKILKHGPVVEKGDGIMTSRWARFITTLTANLTSPIWETVYAKRIRLSKALNYYKMFMCEQIELQPDEYQLARPGAVMYLWVQHRYIYPYEYLAFGSDDDSQRVRVCLEDSGYVKVASSGVGTMQDLLYKVILALEIYNILMVFPNLQLY